MASSWITTRETKSGAKRYRVLYRLGGAGTKHNYAGSFKTMKLARERQKWVDGELAARRVPNLATLDQALTAPTLQDAARQWRESRIDVSPATLLQHRSSIGLMVDALGPKTRLDAISPADVAAAVAELAKTRKRETVRKALNALRMTLDHAGIAPNPARADAIKLPRSDREEIAPPTASHVLAVHDLLPSRYRLPLLTLDATGMRLGELEGLTWGDVDEAKQRWRVSAAVSKTGRARWVAVHPAVFAAVTDLCPRDDRSPDRPVFQGFKGSAFRTQLTRTCTAAGIPAFSPHDLRHRRISLLFRAGVDPVAISRHVGHARASMSLDVYGHVLLDDGELDYTEMLANERPVRTPVHTSLEK